MKKALAVLIAVPAILATSALPARAADPGAVAAAITGSGYWASGITAVPATMNVGFSATMIGTFVVGTSTSTGSVTCTATGRGIESITQGSGTVSLMCAGAASMWTTTTLGYTRVGSAMQLQGQVALTVDNKRSTPTLRITVTVAPSDPVGAAGLAPNRGFLMAGAANAA